MKKLTLLIQIAVLIMTAALISCAADGGSSTDTGYNTITWSRDLAPPDAAKSYTAILNDGACSGDQCLAVAYSASNVLSATDTLNNSTAVAIANTDRTERLIIIFKNVLLTQPDDDLAGTQNDNIVAEGDIIAKHIDVRDPANRSVTTSNTGTTTFDVAFTPIAVTQADASTEVHYLATFTFDTAFTAAGISIGTVDSITAVMYPMVHGEPDMPE